jgi:hypothetical protein
MRKSRFTEEQIVAILKEGAYVNASVQQAFRGGDLRPRDEHLDDDGPGDGRTSPMP